MSNMAKQEILDGMEQERKDRSTLKSYPIELQNEWDEMYRLAQLIKQNKAYVTRSANGTRYTHIRREKRR